MAKKSNQIRLAWVSDFGLQKKALSFSIENGEALTRTYKCKASKI